jgi:hypothetical protein
MIATAAFLLRFHQTMGGEQKTLLKVLSMPYMEFGILPEVHIMHFKTFNNLKQTQNEDWYHTEQLSIRMTREH